MAQIKEQLRTATVDLPLTPLIDAPDGEIEAVWDGLASSHQRFVINTLITVRVMPSGARGSGVFDPEAVEIKFRAPVKAK